MDKWTILKCKQCNRIFAVPYDVVSSDDDGENRAYLECPYCDEQINTNSGFVTNVKVDKKFKKTISYEMLDEDENKLKCYE